MNKQQKAFTLVELIVVITILAILGTIAFISMAGYSKSSRDSVRISDVSNMKTSLELFHLNAGKYPLPDNNEIVEYETQTLWYQGTFGSTVISNLSRNLSEVPTDPLTDKEYIFSVANNKNEFEILSLLEGDLAYNPLAPLSGGIAAVNAAIITVTPRIDGTYNGVFIKTPGYIVPTPSIVTSEEITGGMILNGTNIKSQVTNLGTNIPKVGNVVSNTGGLNIALSVYTGSVTENSDDADKIEAMEAIQGAYSGSILANNDVYKVILSKTKSSEKLSLAGTVLLNTTQEVKVNNCDAGSISGITYSGVTYSYVDVTDGNTTTGNGGQVIIGNGTKDYTTTITCTNGVVELSGENEIISCEGGYVSQGGICVLDQCSGTVPTNAVSNATSQTNQNSWTYNLIPGVCTFACNTNYTWNGSSCVADTKVVSCGGSIPTNASQNIGPSYTQTWNGSSWTPTTSWGESQAICDFDCDTNYSWNGSSCEFNPYTGCTTKGQKLTATTTYGSCNTADIIICSGVGAGYTIAACNVGTNIAGTTSSSYGKYFQWGNNGGMTSTSTTSTTLVNASLYGPGNYYLSTIFILPTSATGYDWSSVQNDNLWGNNGIVEERQGPCISGYHVPKTSEWSGVISAGNLSLWDTAGTTTEGTDFMNALKIPVAGLKVGTSGGVMSQVGSQGKYWSSTASGYQGQYLFFTDSIIGATSLGYRSHGHSIRCFKN